MLHKLKNLLVIVLFLPEVDRGKVVCRVKSEGSVLRIVAAQPAKMYFRTYNLKTSNWSTSTNVPNYI